MRANHKSHPYGHGVKFRGWCSFLCHCKEVGSGVQGEGLGGCESSLEGDPRSGRSTTLEYVYKIYDMTMDVWSLTTRFIANTVGISHDRVEDNHEWTGYNQGFRALRSKASDSWRECSRFSISRDNLLRFKADPDGFVEQFVTVGVLGSSQSAKD